MGDLGKVIFGGEKSGTPIEARGLAKQFGQGLGSFTGPAQRLAGQAQANLFSQFGLGDSLESLLASPTEQTSGLFEAMRPFEQRQLEQQTAQQREQFQSLGGRVGTNAMQADTQLRGELADRFGRQREQLLLGAQQNQLGALQAGIQGLLGAGQQGLAPLQMAAQFAQPGAPVQDPGILPGLIGAGSTLGSAALLGPGAESLLASLFGSGAGAAGATAAAPTASAAILSSIKFKDVDGEVDVAEEANFLQDIEDLKLYHYRYKGQKRERIGPIVEDASTPEYIKNGDFLDSNDVIFSLAAAVKTLSKQVKELQKEKEVADG